MRARRDHDLVRLPLLILIAAPFSPRSSRHNLIRECCGDGMALLLVTHDRPQAERMAKRLLRMSGDGLDLVSESAA